MSQIIYKYLPVERLTYLNDELLRFTQPGDLNDPFECIPILPSVDESEHLVNKLADEKIKSLQKENFPKEEITYLKKEFLKNINSFISDMRNNEPDNFLESYEKELRNRANSKLGIFSLSRRWDSALMWSHYSSSHKGFCIGYNRNSSFFTKEGDNLDLKFFLETVEYSDNRIKVPLEKGIRVNHKVLFTKATDWSYEQEERILASLEHSEKIIESKPFDIYLFKVPHSAIEEIIVGANILPENLENIKRFCDKQNINLFRSMMSKTKFNMERKKIS